MLNITLIHNCLAFQYKKQKFLYGFTLSLLNSSFLLKYRPQYIIIPSAPYVYGLFSHAALQLIMKIVIKINKNSGESIRQNKTVNSRQSTDRNKQQSHFLDKTFKLSRLVLSNQESLSSFYSQQLLERLMETGLVLVLSKFQLKQEQLINKLIQYLNRQVLSTSKTNTMTQSQLIMYNKKPELHPWINCPLYQLKIIIPEIGMSTYLCQGTDLIVVDPTEQFVFYLNNNYIVSNTNQGKQNQIKSGRLLSLLQTVVITKISSVLAVLGLMTVNGVNKIRVIVISDYLEKAIIEKAKKYLLFSQQIVRSRLLIRNIANLKQQGMKFSHKYSIIQKNMNPYTLQSPNTLSFIYYPLSNQNPARIQFQFGSSIDIKSNKRILIYTPTPPYPPNQPSQKKQLEYSMQFELMHFPKQISDENVQLIILYKVQEQLMKQLKTMPQQMRKKIILNRNEHKYNHKYFITFQKGKIQHCSITNMQYVNILANNRLSKSTETKNILASLQQKQVRNKVFQRNIGCISDIQPGSKVYEMGNNAQIQTFGQVITINAGIIQVFNLPNEVQNNKNEVIGVKNIEKGRVLKKVSKIRALKYAQVRIMMQSDFQIQQNRKQIQKLIRRKFIRPLSHYINSKSIQQSTQKKRSGQDNLQHIRTIQNNSLINNLTPYQKVQLNKICHPVTYQVGFKTNNKNSNVYFISKGGMKWEDSDKLAGNSYFIGDMLSFYGIRERMLGKQRQKTTKINKNSTNNHEVQLEFDNFIQVIKDTWALQINIQQFHKYFILENPHLLNFIFSKGKIFN